MPRYATRVYHAMRDLSKGRSLNLIRNVYNFCFIQYLLRLSSFWVVLLLYHTGSRCWMIAGRTCCETVRNVQQRTQEERQSPLERGDFTFITFTYYKKNKIMLLLISAETVSYWLDASWSMCSTIIKLRSWQINKLEVIGLQKCLSRID